MELALIINMGVNGLNARFILISIMFCKHNVYST